ncbi:LOW QUALITY PROTEIN: hypothetical protein TorRG33x02_032040 [Trema orientale]|uniref:Uncharacterized protein n=1 Tax=Trema orientale TaxID=63057 RepID=A0A2P5FTA5_TREOI|nr:LOW QUALITY PROTEIN: hypothetical protein TorRG33x02_032040 [Trema orientale]
MTTNKLDLVPCQNFTSRKSKHNLFPVHRDRKFHLQDILWVVHEKESECDDRRSIVFLDPVSSLTYSLICS